MIASATIATAGALLLMGTIVVKKGWYQIITMLPRVAVSCPVEAQPILVLGQSQASNTGPARSFARSRSFAFADGECFHLQDPMPGTKGDGGSIWPGVADQVDYPLVVANIAVSGSSIEQWTSTSGISAIRSTLEQIRKAGLTQPLIVFMQGETNGARRTSEDSYYRSLKLLVGSIPDSKWLITRESVCYDLQHKWVELDKARNRIAITNRDVSIGPDLDDIPVSMRQDDQCHLNKIGQDILSRHLAFSILDTLKIETCRSKRSPVCGYTNRN